MRRALITDSARGVVLGGPGGKSYSLQPHVARSSCLPAPSVPFLRMKETRRIQGPLKRKRCLGLVKGGLRATWG